jgi:hypothetical protein
VTNATKTIEPTPNTLGVNECDTNADTCCLGKNFIVLNYTSRTADAYAYDKSYKPQEGVPIIAGRASYDDPTTGTTFILVFNEALYYGIKLDHSLINPNQVHSYGIGFSDNPFDHERGLRIDVNDELQIPMQSRGTKIQFTSRTPTTKELQECPHVVMTSPTSWNPQKVSLSSATTLPTESLPTSRISHMSRVGLVTIYEYLDPTSDEALLHSINTSLINLKEQMSNRTINQTTT